MPLFNLFCPKATFSLPILLAIWLINSAVWACNTSPVFGFTQALYFNRYQAAEDFLPRIKAERSTELAEFLREVLRWKLGFDGVDKQPQVKALATIDAQIDSLLSKLAKQKELSTQLLTGNMMLHAARMNLATGRILHAASLAKRGYPLISEVLEQQPENVNAFLTAGLYQYYADQAQSGSYFGGYAHF